MASAGDVNGDGFADILVGARGHDHSSVDGGGAFVYLGGSGGIKRRPRQRQLDNTFIAPLGPALNDDVKLSMRNPSWVGRARTAIEVELKPYGTAFDGTGTTITTVDDSGVGGKLKNVTVSAPADTLMHWRVRLRTDIATSPYQQLGPWFGAHGDAHGTADFRGKSTTTGSSSDNAKATPYGVGTAGTNGVPTLTSTPPSITFGGTLTVANGLPGANPVILFLGFEPAWLGFDQGLLLTPPTFTLALPGLDGNGTLALPMSIPNDVALKGLHVYLQAMFPDPGAEGFYQTAQTNGLEWRIGL